MASCCATAHFRASGCSRPPVMPAARSGRLSRSGTYFSARSAMPTAAAILWRGPFLGPAFTQADIESRLAQAGARFTVASDEDMIDGTAASLAGGQAVGWEFGPRALSLSPFPLRIL